MNLILLANAILVTHAMIVAFAVTFPIVLWIAAARGKRWVHAASWRTAHLLLCAFVAMQAWFGQICPLTIWEHQLRTQAGQASPAADSFIAYWLQRLIFFDAPPWVFTAGYSAFALLMISSFWFIPIRRVR